MPIFSRSIFPICVICGLALLVFTLQGCDARRRASNENSSSGEAPTAGAKASGIIKNVHLAPDDGKGGHGEPADTFGPDDKTIHCVIELAEPAPNAKIRYSWWVVEAGETKNEKIEDVDYTTKPEDRVVHSHLTVPSDWPPGSYKVDIYVNGNMEQTVSFKVE